MSCLRLYRRFKKQTGDKYDVSKDQEEWKNVVLEGNRQQSTSQGERATRVITDIIDFDDQASHAILGETRVKPLHKKLDEMGPFNSSLNEWKEKEEMGKLWCSPGIIGREKRESPKTSYY